MKPKVYHPLSDMGRMKEELLSLFTNTESISNLIEGFYDTPYTQASMSDKKCAVFVETYLIKSEGNRMKEVVLDIAVVCQREASELTDEENTYYHSIGIYGNRVDSALQAIYSVISDSTATDALKQSLCIGNIALLPENPIDKCDIEGDFCGKQLHYTYRSFYQFKK